MSGTLKDSLQFIVLLPTEVLITTTVRKIIAEAMDGYFCLLPRHIDIVSALVPGVVSYFDPAGQEAFVGINEAILVKCGQTVTISTATAVCGSELKTLQEHMREHFAELDEQERRARAALARLESATLRNFWQSREYLNN